MEWIFVGIAAVICVAVIIFVRLKSKKYTLETIVGEKCTVIETVDNYAGSGLVKIGNQQWAARGVSDDSVYEIGEVLSIVAIEGVKLICRK